MLKKIKNEKIKNNTINSYEENHVEKQKAEAAREKAKFLNKPIKYIKKGVTGKKLNNGKPKL